jgi:hypothetical protein
MRLRKANPRTDWETRKRAFRALADMRGGTSYSQAIHNNGITDRKMKLHVGSQIVQTRRGGRIWATKSDRLVRYLQIPGPHGPIDITVRGSKAAREVAKYKSAVNRFLSGDRNALAEWHGKKIQGIELVTAGYVLVDQEDKGSLPYALYRTFSSAAV